MERDGEFAGHLKSHYVYLQLEIAAAILLSVNFRPGNLQRTRQQ
jgi:hypothetical protein